MRVKGIAGVDERLWGSIVPYDINHPIGNIYASAWLLRMFLDEYNGNYLNALTRYKGWCAEGRQRASKVKEIYGRGY